MRLLIVCLLAYLAAAAPFARRGAPTVTIANGTVVGTSLGGIDSFKGIPFAQPPVGPLRLKPPQALSSSFGTFTSVPLPASCPQFFSQVDTSNLASEAIGYLTDSPVFAALDNISEDCLNLNVQRPSGTSARSKLPVVVWFFGGGFELGSTQLYDGSLIISQSVALGHPILFVAINYRVAGFGFLAGKELQAEGSTNLGLRDQRLGLEWVQDNIAAFGGDPSKVTIWGESAGSISVFDQTIINGGDNTYKGSPLFRAAIMDSGSIVPALPVNHAKPQAVFDQVANVAGCGSASDVLACLRGLDYDTFLNAANSVPAIFSYSSIDLSYLPRPDPNDNFFPVSPDEAVLKGAFAKVPIIIGDQEDEGTLFSLVQGNISNTAELETYLQSYFPLATPAQISGLVATYPDRASDGSPFNTGILNEIYPEFKRLAAILGDLSFTLARRVYLDVVSQSVNSWSYLSSYLYGVPVLGTFHGSDILELFFGLPDAVPEQSALNYYISFINTLNPNSYLTLNTLLNWPKWSGGNPQLMNFQALGNAVIPDDFRQDSYNFLAANAASFKI